MISLILPWVAKVTGKTESRSASGTSPSESDAAAPLHVVLDARRFVACLHGCTVAPGMQWRPLSRIVSGSGLESRRAPAAIAEAVRRGWVVIGLGDVCLTDLGRDPAAIDLGTIRWSTSVSEASLGDRALDEA